jgi:dynein heavy chain 1
MQVQRDVANSLMPFFASDGLVKRTLEYASTLEHIMDFTRLRALGSLFSMINQAVRNILQYNHSHADFPMQSDQVEKYASKCLVHAILWSFTGDAKLKVRNAMGEFVRSATTIPLPPNINAPILDFEVSTHQKMEEGGIPKFPFYCIF